MRNDLTNTVGEVDYNMVIDSVQIGDDIVRVILEDRVGLNSLPFGSNTGDAIAWFLRDAASRLTRLQ